jgi:hypothetical protein
MTGQLTARILSELPTIRPETPRHIGAGLFTNNVVG